VVENPCRFANSLLQAQEKRLRDDGTFVKTKAEQSGGAKQSIATQQRIFITQQRRDEIDRRFLIIKGLYIPTAINLFLLMTPKIV
jgi:hypothetical protein